MLRGDPAWYSRIIRFQMADHSTDPLLGPVWDCAVESFQVNSAITIQPPAVRSPTRPAAPKLEQQPPQSTLSTAASHRINLAGGTTPGFSIPRFRNHPSYISDESTTYSQLLFWSGNHNSSDRDNYLYCYGHSGTVKCRATRVRICFLLFITRYGRK